MHSATHGGGLLNPSRNIRSIRPKGGVAVSTKAAAPQKPGYLRQFRTKLTGRTGRVMPPTPLRPRVPWLYSETSTGGDVEDGPRSSQFLARAATTKSPTSPAPGSKAAAPVGTMIAMVVFIAGTTIGGGTLALPAASAKAGFVPAVVGLVLCWAFLSLQALLMVEVQCRMKREEGLMPSDKVVSFEMMARRTLGKASGVFIGATYQCYGYASILAYVSGVGGVVSQLLNGVVSPKVGQTAVVLGLWAVIVLAGKNGIEWMNEKLNYVFFALMAMILAKGMLAVSGPALAHISWPAAPAATGIILFNVVYHDVIPLVCSALKYNPAHIMPVLLAGGVIPLVLYVLWVAVALSAAGPMIPGQAFVDPLVTLMSSPTIAGRMVQVWALLAIGTSFIGCGMAQAEYEASVLTKIFGPRIAKGAAAGSKFMMSLKRFFEGPGLVQISYAFVLIPPLLISLSFPNLFAVAADFAGVFGVCILYGIMPPMMAWSLRKEKNMAMSPTGAYQPDQGDLVFGGKPVLAFLFCLSASIILRSLIGFIPAGILGG